jgi:hypothetical protein
MRGASEFRQGRNIAGSSKNEIADAAMPILFIGSNPCSAAAEF